MDRVPVFQNELSWIQNITIRKFAEEAINQLPDYFYEVAASSTGKFHPAYALGNGGLVRHTKAAVKIAHELLGLEMYGRYTSDERDLMLTALILHDGWKHGSEANAGQYTVAEHPKVCADWIKSNRGFESLLTEEQIDFLCGCIESHMGQWNTDYRTKKEILPKPKTPAQKFVHQADLLASRKWLNVDFDDDYYAGVENKSEGEDTESDSELNAKIAQIVSLCNKIIRSNTASRTKVMEIVSNENNGNRNPNSIKDVEVANKVMRALEELNG